MNAKIFAELAESVREGGATLRGETAPSRTNEITARRTRATSPSVKGIELSVSGDEIVDFVRARRERFELETL